MKIIALASGLCAAMSLTAQTPELEMKLSGERPLEMPGLMPYLLHASASATAPDTISSVVFHVDGMDLPARKVNGAYQAFWTPAQYGLAQVSATATAGDGSTASAAADVMVVNSATTQTVATFDGAVINFDGSGESQWHYGTFVLPQSVGAYEYITAHLVISCPSVAGGCDDWDRLAWIQAKAPNGEWVEIIRYITPYGKPCNHQIDVTDFASLLQGHTELRMYIETWGTGGWKIDLDLAYQSGTPDYAYTTVQTAWQGNYNFGDPINLQPVPTVSINTTDAIDAAKLRMTTTGHGWGPNNTGNAAEFYQADHQIMANTHAFDQQLWTICNPNPDGCQPQFGTWQYNRAGWCPGSISRPYEYDLTPYLDQGVVQLSYIFQPTYRDFCHPNNPNCVSGATCPDCNDGYNPYYRVAAYVIAQSNTPIQLGMGHAPATLRPATLTLSPNPTRGQFRLHLDREMGPNTVTVHDASGRTLRTWLFQSSDQAGQHLFGTGSLGSGTYFVKMQGRETHAVAVLVATE